MSPRAFDKQSGLAFIVAFGIVSLFADAAYEGMRGPTFAAHGHRPRAATTVRG